MEKIRPKIEDYYEPNASLTFEYDMTSYYKDLEKYCDELERKWRTSEEVHEIYRQKIKSIVNGIIRAEKAFAAACVRLEEQDLEIAWLLRCKEYEPKDRDKWKEICLKDAKD